MSDSEDEIISLQKEYDWFLQEQVTIIIDELKNLIIECARHFPIPPNLVLGVETLVKSEKFLLTNSNLPGGQTVLDQIQAIVTLIGDNICHADIHLKLHKHPITSHRTLVQNDCQWKLQQIQDASNHLVQALDILSLLQESKRIDFQSAEEIISVVNKLMSCLQRGRGTLLIPKKRTIADLQHSRNMKSLQPPLPNDLALSFYIQSHRLVFAVYHMLSREAQGPPKFDVFQAESSVPWLSEAVVLFTLSLQLCQQLKDKVAVFSQFKEINVL